MADTATRRGAVADYIERGVRRTSPDCGIFANDRSAFDRSNICDERSRIGATGAGDIFSNAATTHHCAAGGAKFSANSCANDPIWITDLLTTNATESVSRSKPRAAAGSRSATNDVAIASTDRADADGASYNRNARANNVTLPANRAAANRASVDAARCTDDAGADNGFWFTDRCTTTRAKHGAKCKTNTTLDALSPTDSARPSNAATGNSIQASLGAAANNSVWLADHRAIVGAEWFGTGFAGGSGRGNPIPTGDGAAAPKAITPCNRQRHGSARGRVDGGVSAFRRANRSESTTGVAANDANFASYKYNAGAKGNANDQCASASSAAKEVSDNCRADHANGWCANFHSDSFTALNDVCIQNAGATCAAHRRAFRRFVDNSGADNGAFAYDCSIRTSATCARLCSKRPIAANGVAAKFRSSARGAASTSGWRDRAFT